MRELILQSARLRLPRLLLLALGAALMTAGLSYLLGTLQRSQTQVMDQMEDRWKVSYDLLIRPSSSKDPDGYFTPGRLAGAGGGISLDQWQQIKAIEGVEIAAPVTQVGWVNYPVSVNVKTEDGSYRLAWHLTQSDGLQTYTAQGTDAARVAASGDYASLPLSVPLRVAVVAVDPEAEARLLGLARAVTAGTYFGLNDDRSARVGPVYTLPVLVSGADYGGLGLTLQMERLDGPGGMTWQAKSLSDLLMGRLDTTKIQPNWSAGLIQAPEPTLYATTVSLDPARWPLAFRAELAGSIPLPNGIQGTPFASWRFSGISEGDNRQIRFHSVGTYDPARVPLSHEADPSAALYRMGAAELAFDDHGNPAGSPTQMKPLAHPNAYLTSPPALITTLGAAQELIPGAPIGMIRVKVAGVEQISPESIEKVQKVAKAITAATGLTVDIMRGASPDPVLVQLPGVGYFAQTWLHKGQAVQLFGELRRGDALVMGLVLLVGVVFVLATSIVHVMLRQRELSTLAAVGWRTRHLLLLVLAEAGMVALAGGIAACLALPRLQTLEAALGTLLLYTLGAVLATLATGITTPMRLILGAGVTPNKRLAHVENLRQVSWGSLWARRRNLLSLSALVLPTALSVILTALTVRLEERLFVTVLGSQIALSVGPLHYALMFAAFALAAATTADLMSLSVLERRTELVLLSAMGWTRKTVRALVLWEGVLWGLTAGLGGTALGLGALYLIYGRIQSGLWAILPLVLLVPTVTGLIGAIAPAESAARMQPARGVKAA